MQPPRRCARALLTQAIEAGKHVYCEKPVATNLDDALDLVPQGEGAWHQAWRGAGQAVPARSDEAEDAASTPASSAACSRCAASSATGCSRATCSPRSGRRGTTAAKTAAASSSTCCATGATCSTTCSATCKSVSCLGATHIPERFDEAGKRYKATADDAAYATFELAARSGDRVIAQINSSWTTRVRRDDLVTFHVDGTHGSAVAGLHDCRTQSRVNTPKPVWNPDVKQPLDFFEHWQPVPEYTVFDNGFKTQWEAFIRHVVEDAPVQVESARRRQGRAARRMRAAQLEGAALDRCADVGGLICSELRCLLRFAVPSLHPRGAAGGTRCGLLLWRSALQADSAVMLAPGSRRETRCTHCVRLRSDNRGESDERSALRAPTPRCASRRPTSRPHRVPPTAQRRSWCSTQGTVVPAKPRVGVRRQRHMRRRGAEALMAARASAHVF